MKEIKFRGIALDSRDWVYGGIYKDYIIEGDRSITDRDGTMLGRCQMVVPKTIGQFTGLYDIDEVEIYEGDYKLEIIGNVYQNEQIH